MIRTFLSVLTASAIINDHDPIISNFILLMKKNKSPFNREWTLTQIKKNDYFLMILNDLILPFSI